MCGYLKFMFYFKFYKGEKCFIAIFDISNKFFSPSGAHTESFVILTIELNASKHAYCAIKN